MATLEENWFKLKWELALLICLIFISAGVGYHFAMKPVPKNITIKNSATGIECPFLQCYDFEGWQIYWMESTERSHEYELGIKFNSKREKLILSNAMSDLKNIFGHTYEGRKFTKNLLAIELDTYVNCKVKIGDKLSRIHVKRVGRAIQDSQSELEQLFSRK